MDLADNIKALKGIGPKKAEVLSRLGIETIKDLLYFFPRTYQDRREVCKIADLQDKQTALICGKVKLMVNQGYRYGKNRILRLLVEDETGTMEIIFFHAQYLSGSFQKGKEYCFYGTVKSAQEKFQMIHPEFSQKENDSFRGIIPVYPLTSGISQNEIRKFEKTGAEAVTDIEEYLPQDLILKNNLCDLRKAITNIHFPQNKRDLLEAKFRLIFDELLILQLGLLKAKENNTDNRNVIKLEKKIKVEPYIESLPYRLTKAQKKVAAEIISDLESGKVMNRLVQGDVGSGKTVVAEIALYKTVKCGYQGAFMAPTELLAKQHLKSLEKSFSAHGIGVACLTGSMSKKEKDEILKKLSLGQIHIIIGTHALLQENVSFQKLGIVITDEQHRFGVNQRNVLKEKGENPHVLVMTATPIPRTLAVVIYGDLDISIIDELPPGRQKITTKAVTGRERKKVYEFVKNQLAEGRQAYVVAPLIEDSDTIDVLSAENLFKELQNDFTEYNLALLHGGMKQKEKDSIMESFYEGKIHMLVSTVVVEVGINVPNATAMVIENSERFGLAQLHQLRGRIGRGKHKSFCFLINQSDSEIAKERANIMTRSQDGFYIAEEDLNLRGPGELFGTRQHGIPDLHMADLVKHIQILDRAKEEATEILKRDKNLENEEYQGLRQQLHRMFGQHITLKI